MRSLFSLSSSSFTGRYVWRSDTNATGNAGARAAAAIEISGYCLSRLMHKRFRLMPSLLLAGWLIAACTGVSPTGPSQVALRTQPPGYVCMQALTDGVLVADPKSGVGLRGAGGATRPVIWPTGWTAARADASGIAIVDTHGAIVAHVGDTVTMGGGNGNDGDWYVCPPVQVVGASPA